MSSRSPSIFSPLLKRTILLLLVLLYCAGTVRMEWIHRLIHQHEPADLHSEEQERNPCHQAIFHAAAKQACEHPTHFTADWKCPVCDYVCPSHLTGSETFISKKILICPEYPCQLTASPDKQLRTSRSPRAPPFC